MYIGDMQSQRADHSFAQRQRFRFIESILLWEGSVQRRRVCDQFGVAANHVTKDLATYQAECPGSLEFKPNIRAYVPGPKFNPVYTSDDPNEYLALLLAHAQSGSTAILPALGGGAITAEALPEPNHNIDRSVLQSLVRALRNHTGVSVRYHSTSDDRPRRRTLWPHALLHTGVRWHIRAYDSRRETYRNFALQRMDSPKPIDETKPELAAVDVGWTRSSKLNVAPNPLLNLHQQQLVARDFGMRKRNDSWRWSVTLRNCLVPYFARRYGLVSPPPLEPKQHRIVFEDYESVRDLLSD